MPTEQGQQTIETFLQEWRIVAQNVLGALTHLGQACMQRAS